MGSGLEETKSAFSTRLEVNGKPIERIEETKVLGVWISTFLDWSRNTDEICRKAYMKLGMLTKLKYVGTNTNDLLTIYKQFIRCNLDYCSSLYHSTLTQEQTSKLERVKKVCLRVILGEE